MCNARKDWVRVDLKPIPLALNLIELSNLAQPSFNIYIYIYFWGGKLQLTWSVVLIITPHFLTPKFPNAHLLTLMYSQSYYSSPASIFPSWLFLEAINLYLQLSKKKKHANLIILDIYI